MASQLPSEVVGLAIGILIYSLFSLSLGLLTAWLIWVHRERTSYVSLLIAFTAVGGLASIAQQIHTIVRWRDIKLDQHHQMVENIGNPQLALAGNSIGFDLALFYIQFTCYGIEALLVFFWSAVLLQSVFQLRTLVNSLRYSNLIAKLCAILIPITMVCLLQAKAIQHSTVGFFIVANICMTVGLAGGAAMLLSILGRYIYSRRTLVSFNFRYGKSSTKHGSYARSKVSTSTGSRPQPRPKIYDRWLILRLAVGFVALGIFQLITIATEVTAQSRNNRSHLSKTADLSVPQAKLDFVLFIPGATPPLVTFIVFGTTRPFREYMWNVFVPRFLRGRDKSQTLKNSHDLNPTGGSSSHEVHIYSINGELGHEVTGSIGSGVMLSNLRDKRREEDAIPILESSSGPAVGLMSVGK